MYLKVIDGGGPTYFTLVNNNLWGEYLNGFFLGPRGGVFDLDTLNGCGWQNCDEASGNISVDPEFADPTDLDFHLSNDSPSIDAGVDPTPWYEGIHLESDLDGHPRPIDGDGDGVADWDIGADEAVP